MITLKTFLKDYAKSSDLQEEYKQCDKDAILKEFLDTRQEKESVPKKLSNVAISKAVDAKIERITASVCLCQFLDTFLITSLVLGAQSNVWD
jgi:hypothetical protein